LLQVSKSFTESIDISSDSFSRDVGLGKNNVPSYGEKFLDPRNELLSDCIVRLHISVRDVNKKL
jgi:hypothetical protein